MYIPEKVVVNAISEWENKMLVLENVRNIPESVFVKFVATNKKLFANAISQWDNIMLVWENVRYIPEKVFVIFQNPRVYN